jgi:hypothetical protein
MRPPFLNSVGLMIVPSLASNGGKAKKYTSLDLRVLAVAVLHAVKPGQAQAPPICFLPQPVTMVVSLFRVCSAF